MALPMPVGRRDIPDGDVPPARATMLVHAGQLPAARADKTLSTTAVPQLLWKEPGPYGPGAAFYVAGIIPIASGSKSYLVALTQRATASRSFSAADHAMIGSGTRSVWSRCRRVRAATDRTNGLCWVSWFPPSLSEQPPRHTAWRPCVWAGCHRGRRKKEVAGEPATSRIRWRAETAAGRIHSDGCSSGSSTAAVLTRPPFMAAYPWKPRLSAAMN